MSGTLARIETYRQRAERMEALFHPEDCKVYAPPHMLHLFMTTKTDCQDAME
jgi:hypothetical protein